jgi:hypothetical protein
MSRGEGPDPTAGEHGKDIQQFIDILKRNDLAELEWETDGFRIHLKRDTGPVGPVLVSRDAQPTAKGAPPRKKSDSSSI